MDQILKYKCPKCGTSQYEIGEIWAASSMVTRILGFHNRRFTSVTCKMCHFTEFYKVPRKEISEVLNFTAR
jgi:predicted nucleic-acid-binding Zn-ribbon protein